MLLLALAGVIVAGIRWKRHPRASLMTISALVIYVIDAFVFSIVIYYVPYLIRNMELSSKTVDWLYFSIYFFDDFVTAAIIVLLVAAAFTQRRLSSPPAAIQES
jgi:hypothetical protein